MNNKRKVIAFNPAPPIPPFSKDMPVTEEQFSKIISAETLFDKLEGLEANHCSVKLKFTESTIIVTCRYENKRCLSMEFHLMPSSLNLASIEVPEKLQNKGIMKTILLNFLTALYESMSKSQKKIYRITAETIHIGTYNFFNPINRDPKIKPNREGRIVVKDVIYCDKKLEVLLKEHNKKANRPPGESCTLS